MFQHRYPSYEDDPFAYVWPAAQAVAVDWWAASDADGGFWGDGPRREQTEREEAAVDLVERLCDAGDPRAVDVMVVLADASPDRDSLFFLGAKVAKRLINDHGDALVDQLVRAATEHPRIRIAFSGRHAWLGRSKLGQETLDQLWPWIGVDEDERTPF